MVASSVGVSADANRYTSMLNITVGHEMIIECIHDTRSGISTIGQEVRRITEGNVAVGFQFG